MSNPPRIGILSLSAIPDDPRVRRQGDLFAEAGWDVVALGLAGAQSKSPSWKCLAIEAEELARKRKPALAKQLSRPFRWPRRLLEQMMMRVDQNYALDIYWTMNPDFRRLYNVARSEIVDIWLANDWTSLPIALALSRERNIPYVYDTHELAVDEHAQSRRWRVLQRPVIAAVEGLGVRSANFVSCVSHGIADRLSQIHRMDQQPIVIRNMPHYEAHDVQPTGEAIRVLYHGLVAPGRGLEACVLSVASWRPELSLTIRGPAKDSYLASLRKLALEANVSARVTFAPSVPMVDLIHEASSFDIGLFALPGHSLQNIHVLPNKFFEYTMAGLALCVSDLPEMSGLLRQFDLGRLIPEVSAQAIGAAINSFDRAAIDYHKSRAIYAAHELNWEREGTLFLQRCAQAIGSPQPSRVVAGKM